MATQTRDQSVTDNQPNANFTSWVAFTIVLAIIVIGALAYAIYKPNLNSSIMGSPTATESSSMANPNTTNTTNESSTVPVNPNGANPTNPGMPAQ